MSARLAKASGRGDARANTSEANIIEKVERIGPEYELETLVDLEIPGKAQVLIQEVRVAKPVGARRRGVAIGKRIGGFEGIHINKGRGVRHRRAFQPAGAPQPALAFFIPNRPGGMAAAVLKLWTAATYAHPASSITRS